MISFVYYQKVYTDFADNIALLNKTTYHQVSWSNYLKKNFYVLTRKAQYESLILATK